MNPFGGSASGGLGAGGFGGFGGKKGKSSPLGSGAAPSASPFGSPSAASGLGASPGLGSGLGSGGSTGFGGAGGLPGGMAGGAAGGTPFGGSGAFGKSSGTAARSRSGSFGAASGGGGGTKRRGLSSGSETPFGKRQDSAATPGGAGFGQTGAAATFGATPFGKKAGATPFGKKAGGTPFGKKAGTTPFGKKAGGTPFGKAAGATPFGGQTVATPFGGAAAASPFAKKGSAFEQKAASSAFKQTSAPMAFGQGSMAPPKSGLAKAARSAAKVKGRGKPPRSPDKRSSAGVPVSPFSLASGAQGAQGAQPRAQTASFAKSGLKKKGRKPAGRDAPAPFGGQAPTMRVTGLDDEDDDDDDDDNDDGVNGGGSGGGGSGAGNAFRGTGLNAASAAAAPLLVGSGSDAPAAGGGVASGGFGAQPQPQRRRKAAREPAPFAANGSSSSARRNRGSNGNSKKYSSTVATDGGAAADGGQSGVVGECMDMCPEREAAKRVAENDWFVLEKPRSDGAVPQHYLNAHQDASTALFVKRYQRSAADHTVNKPWMVRPPRVLLRTQDYLERYVLGAEAFDDARCKSGRPRLNDDVYQFFWDRNRMVRKDLTLQNYIKGQRSSGVAIRILERSVRCLIYLDHVMSVDADYRKVHRKQNMEQLVEALTTCEALYDNARAAAADPGALVSKYEPEICAYYLVLNCGEPMQCAGFLRRLPACVDAAPPMVLAKRVVAALRDNDWVGFSRLFHGCDNVVMRCMLATRLPRLREKALRRIVKHSVGVTTAELTQSLLFEDEESCAEFCRAYGAALHAHPTKQTYLVNKKLNEARIEAPDALPVLKPLRRLIDDSDLARGKRPFEIVNPDHADPNADAQLSDDSPNAAASRPSAEGAAQAQAQQAQALLLQRQQLQQQQDAQAKLQEQRQQQREALERKEQQAATEALRLEKERKAAREAAEEERRRSEQEAAARRRRQAEEAAKLEEARACMRVVGPGGVLGVDAAV